MKSTLVALFFILVATFGSNICSHGAEKIPVRRTDLHSGTIPAEMRELLQLGRLGNQHQFLPKPAGNAILLRVTSQLWDSSGQIWNDMVIDTNMYNANGDIVEKISRQTYTQGLPPVTRSRNTYAYDANRNLIEQMYYDWSGTMWTPNQHDVFTFDDRQRMTSHVTSNQNSGAMVYSSQQVYRYTSSPDTVEILYQQWGGSAWINTSRIVDVYDVDGNLVGFTFSMWTSGAWHAQMHTLYTFDANHHPLTVTLQTAYGGPMTNTERWTYTYDAQGNCMEISHKIWNSVQWMDSEREGMSYNATNKVIRDTTYRWLNGAWTGSSLALSSYDAQDRTIDYRHEVYSNSAWTDSYLDHYEYDADGNTILHLFQQNNGAGLQNYSRTLFAWGNTALGVDQSPALVAGYKLNANYPNPFNPSTKISYNLPKVGQVTLTVFDMLGREVTTLINEQQMPGEHEVNWNAASAASGLYYYRLTAGGFTLTRSMMLVK